MTDASRLAEIKCNREHLALAIVLAWVFRALGAGEHADQTQPANYHVRSHTEARGSGPSAYACRSPVGASSSMICGTFARRCSQMTPRRSAKATARRSSVP
jgi:hypothetical protein